MGIQLPSPKGAPQTIFCSYLLWPSEWIKMPLDREVGLGPSNIALDGDPAPAPPKRGRAPKFLAHVYCGQRAGWIKMPLSMKVDLGPVHIVLDGDAALPPKKGAQPPILDPCLLWSNGWMDQDATWYRGRLDGDPAAPPLNGAQPSLFAPCLLWPNGWMDQHANLVRRWASV